MKITKCADCGNSPKNDFVQSFCIALMKADIGFVSRSVAENIVWVIGNKQPLIGMTPFLDAINQLKRKKKLALKIQHVMSHGKVGAANGTLRLQSGDEINFCHVFEFTNTTGAHYVETTAAIEGGILASADFQKEISKYLENIDQGYSLDEADSGIRIEELSQAILFAIPLVA